MLDISNLRRDFSLKSLDEKDIKKDPILFFEQWLNEAIKAEALEPTAMNLATATAEGRPSSRIVLLKKIRKGGFVFFTNYNSRKAKQIKENRYCALNFNWNELERQVRIEGIVEKISPEESDSYFEMRPPKSKLGAWASPQSREIPNREYLEELVTSFNQKFEGQIIPRPENWGGYIVYPHLIEFWQGRPSRLHDRIQYCLAEGEWKIVRLAP